MCCAMWIHEPLPPHGTATAIHRNAMHRNRDAQKPSRIGTRHRRTKAKAQRARSSLRRAISPYSLRTTASGCRRSGSRDDRDEMTSAASRAAPAPRSRVAMTTLRVAMTTSTVAMAIPDPRSTRPRTIRRTASRSRAAAGVSCWPASGWPWRRSASVNSLVESNHQRKRAAVRGHGAHA